MEKEIEKNAIAESATGNKSRFFKTHRRKIAAVAAAAAVFAAGYGAALSGANSSVRAAVMDLVADGRYRCCLEKPCSYCYIEHGSSGDGAVCDCVADIVAGSAPCGECIGEILEGNGNPLLAEYFASAIASETGASSRPALVRFVEETYGMPAGNQI